MRVERHIADRIGFFVKHGYLQSVPTRWQVRVGGLAMLPVFLSESERERSRSRTTLMGQVPIRVPLQVLYNPRQIFPDTGITHRPQQIVRHLLSVYHEDAALGYDLQLLQSHPGGLTLLEEAASRVIAGRTWWAPYLRRLVAWPDYHRRLRVLAKAAARFEYPDPLDLDPRFATLVGFARFCRGLPDWPMRGFYNFEVHRIGK